MSQEFIKVKCPECQKRLKVPARKASRKIRCPECEALFRSEIGVAGQSPSARSTLKPTMDIEIVDAELVAYGPGIDEPSRFKRNPEIEAQQDTPLSDNSVNRKSPNGLRKKKRATTDLVPDSWWDTTDLAPFETADGIPGNADQPKEHSKRNSFFRNVKKRSHPAQTSPENPRQFTEELSPSDQDLGPCLATCKRQTNLHREVKKIKPDFFAWLCMILFSILFAFLAGLVSLHFLNLQTNFTMASNSQKTLIIGIYIFFFLASLSFIFYLSRRSTHLCQDAAVEARQRGVRISVKGRQFQIPYEQVRKVFRAPESDLSRLMGSLLAGQGQATRDSLVLETDRGKKIHIPRCDEMFTAHSLADVIREINCRAEMAATPVHQSQRT